MTTTDLSTSWIVKNGTEGKSSEDNNPLKDFTLLKVYNPMMGSVPDLELDGQIVQLDSEKGWIPFGKTLSSIKVLELTKCYKGYANRLGESGEPIKDDNGKVIKDLYFTPEVSVYDKSNIALAKMTENGPVVLGKGGFKNYIDFTTSMKDEDGNINPLFDTIGTNSNTGEKYPISIMRQEYSMYFESDGKLYKIRLGASYGRWKDIKDGTFLKAKEEGMKAFDKLFNTIRFEFHYLTLSATVEKADKYKYLEWQFEEITSKSVMDELAITRKTIQELNEKNFPGIDINNGIEALPFSSNRLALAVGKKANESIETKKESSSNEDIVDIDDLPF